MERLVEVGNEPKGRLLEVNAQLSDGKTELYTGAVNNRDIAKLNLLHVMNMTQVEGFEIEAKPDLPDPSAVKQFLILIRSFNMRWKHRPQIKSAEYGIESM
jgi:hypothetical protein